MLNILIRTQMNAIPEAAAVCFTKVNTGGSSTVIPANSPLGVLGGSVAAYSAGNDYTVVPGTEALMPAGLFVNNAAGAAFENSPAVASGKVTVIKGLASVEVDVYETQTAADAGVDLEYAVGQYLYSSDNGLLTYEVSSSRIVIGVVTKVPTPSSPALGLDMRI